MFALLAATFLALLAPVPQELPALPELVHADIARWREHVRPSAEELGFEALPWIPSFSEGLKAASAQGRPLLFWAMNGHPLGCT